MWKLQGDGKWTPGIEPVTPHDGDGDGVGPGLAFAKALLRQEPSAAILLVPCAVGETDLRDWLPGTALYDASVKRTKAALRSSEGKLCGVLWHQGEGDSRFRPASRYYQPRLRNLVEALRADLNAPHLPFLAGELGTAFLSQFDGFRFARQVNAATRGVSTQLDDFAIVPQARTHMHDGKHYDPNGQRVMGNRFADVWLRVHARRRQSKKLEKAEKVEGAKSPTGSSPGKGKSPKKRPRVQPQVACGVSQVIKVSGGSGRGDDMAEA